MTDVVKENSVLEDSDDPDLDDLDVFDDNKFLDEIVDCVVMPSEQPRMVRTENSPENTKSNDGEQNDTKVSSNDEEPVVQRCLDEIDKLTKSIQRRKQKLREGNERVKFSKERRSYSRDRGRSKTPPFNRNVRNRERRSPAKSRYLKRGRSRSRSRSRQSRERRSNRSRDRRSPRNNRRDKRTRSKSPSNQPRNMTFIEELEHKFAENGQDFPEKNLLLQIQARKGIDVSSVNTYAANMTYSQCGVAPYMQPMPMYNQPYQPSWNGNYFMPNSMNIHPMQSITMPTAVIGCAGVQQTEINSRIGFSSWNRPTNKAEAVAKCRNASKILRSEENKVPKLRFLYTNTSMPLDSNEEKIPPLQSRKNVEFELTSEDQQSLAPLNFVPPRTRDLVKIFGYNCNTIISHLRLKEHADQMLHDIEDMDAQTKKAKEKKFTENGSQTEAFKCSNCINRESKTYVNKAVQIDGPRQVSIRTQTNERDYREPLIRSLSRMTPGQLVAIKDFAQLICEPRPSTSVEIFKVREKLMDIFNLAERGSEAIEAEWQREQEIRHRTMGTNNQAIGGVPLDQLDLRVTMRSSSDNMGRIPPPPPMLGNYRLNNVDIDDMRRAADEEHEQRRLQQLRFEENRRQLEMEEQRAREIEWERAQIIQQQQHQQMQLQREQLQREQLQREHEEVALQLSRNERKRSIRGRGNWGGGRGRGRY